VWLKIGFTSDDVIGAGQDWRLAEQFIRAWEGAGRPEDFRVMRTGGEREHFIYWYVNEVAAAIFDAGGLRWRDRIVEAVEAPPPEANEAIKRRSRAPTDA
jgi:hypothetical protein